MTMPHNDTAFLRERVLAAVGNGSADALIDLARWCLDEHPPGHILRREALAHADSLVALADSSEGSLRTATMAAQLQEERASVFAGLGCEEDADRATAAAGYIRAIRIPALAGASPTESHETARASFGLGEDN